MGGEVEGRGDSRSHHRQSSTTLGGGGGGSGDEQWVTPQKKKGDPHAINKVEDEGERENVMGTRASSLVERRANGGSRESRRVGPKP